MAKPKRSHSQAPSRIPEFANYDEERAFWDTHDLSDFWDNSAIKSTAK